MESRTTAGAPPTDPPRSRRLVVLFAALPALLALALHAPSLRHQFVIDDDAYIARNPAVTHGAPLVAYFLDPTTTASDEALRRQVYRPLRTLAFRAIARLGGVHPLPFAVASRLLYAAAAVLVLLVVRRLVPATAAALWASLAWTAASIHVEPVVYHSALGDLLSLVLQLGALLAGLHALAAKRRLPWAAASLGLGAAALGAKEMAIVTPLLFLGLALALRAPRRPALGLVAAHAILGVGFVLLRTRVLGQLGQVPWVETLFLAGIQKAPFVVAHYTRLTLAPFGHAPAYLVAAPGWGWSVLGWMGMLGALGLAFASRRRAFCLGVTWFLVALLPVLQVVPVLADLADRFALLPSVGAAVVVGDALAALTPRSPALVLFFGSVATALGGAGTLVEARPWVSDDVLWRYAVALQPASGQAHNNLGIMLIREGFAREGLAELDRARALGYDDEGVEMRRAIALHALGRLPEAEAVVGNLLCNRPDFDAAHGYLGILYLAEKRRPEAERELALARRTAANHQYTAMLARKLAEAQRFTSP